MNQILPNKKKELTTKQEKFLSVLFNNGGQVMAAIEEAGYSPDSRGWLMHSVKNEIIERAKTQLAGSSVKAVNRLHEGLDADGTIPSGQMDVRMKAASEILDRAGISKRQEINIEGQVLHGVVMLPAKDKIKTINE
jgi:hypothetical protein